MNFPCASKFLLIYNIYFVLQHLHSIYTLLIIMSNLEMI